MSVDVVLGEKISNFISFTSSTQEESQEVKMNRFLDFVSKQRSKFEQLTVILTDLDDYLYKEINNYQDSYQSLYKDLLRANSITVKLLATYKKKPKIYSALKTAIKSFEEEVGVFQELINDMDLIYIQSQDPEVKKLVSKL